MTVYQAVTTMSFLVLISIFFIIIFIYNKKRFKGYTPETYIDKMVINYQVNKDNKTVIVNLNKIPNKYEESFLLKEFIHLYPNFHIIFLFGNKTFIIN